MFNYFVKPLLAEKVSHKHVNETSLAKYLTKQKPRGRNKNKNPADFLAGLISLA